MGAREAAIGKIEVQDYPNRKGLAQWYITIIPAMVGSLK
jgi:hypothetical protein